LRFKTSRIPSHTRHKVPEAGQVALKEQTYSSDRAVTLLGDDDFRLIGYFVLCDFKVLEIC
jgi:hypothetical protein